ncbi:MAG: hypothetical protein ACLPZJ_00550, partial [Terriglobales bacterium]
MREEVEKGETAEVSIIEAVAERCCWVRPFYSSNPRSSQGQGVVQTDPASVAFCNEVGLDYVSCSPFRVPIARLAAA